MASSRHTAVVIKSALSHITHLTNLNLWILSKLFFLHLPYIIIVLSAKFDEIWCIIPWLRKKFLEFPPHEIRVDLTVFRPSAANTSHPSSLDFWTDNSDRLMMKCLTLAMKAKIIAWKEVKLVICDIFIIIIKITSDVMRFDAIELMFSLDSDKVL